MFVCILDAGNQISAFPLKKLIMDVPEFQRSETKAADYGFLMPFLPK
jgi:hypothetical protein